MTTTDSMTTHSFFDTHFDLDNESLLPIGTCRCGKGNACFARLDRLSAGLDMQCTNKQQHTWAEVSLLDGIGHLASPSKKTTKTRMLAELRSWQDYREAAPELETGGMQLVPFKETLQAAAREREEPLQQEGGGEGLGGIGQEGEDDDGEEIIEVEPSDAVKEMLREQREMRRDGSNGGDANKKSRKKASNTAVEVVAESAGSAGYAGREDEAQDGSLVRIPKQHTRSWAKAVAMGVVRLVKDGAMKYGPFLVTDTAYLLAAYHVGDEQFFLAAAGTCLPKYFESVPNWADRTFTHLALPYVKQILNTAVIRTGFDLARQHLRITPAQLASITLMPMDSGDLAARQQVEALMKNTGLC